MNFTCPRTCPKYGELWCRFRPITDAIGSVMVNSHTAKIKVDYTCHESFGRAVESLNGKMLGNRSHRLFETTENGLGFNLPDWRFPLVLKSNGELSFDDFNGSWGNRADLEKLKGAYAMAISETAAKRQGWNTERINGELIIYHPDGGMLTIASNGQLATSGFTGNGCHSAVEQLGIVTTDVHNTAEFSQTAQRIELPQA